MKVTLIILSTLCLLPPAATGQIAITLEAGSYDAVTDNPYEQWSSDGSNRGDAFSVTFHMGNVLDEGGTHRYGLRVMTQSLKRTRDDNRTWTFPQSVRHRATLLLFEYERILMRHSRAVIVANLGFGLSWRSDDYEMGCDAPFCDLPSLGLAASPGLRAVFPIVGDMSLTFGAHGLFQPGPREETWPFTSGLGLMAGIELYSAPQQD
ncbi:MAG: hypothetical protein GY835_13730 [bacterium]|nr:hypothetical protein [bacterium]